MRICVVEEYCRYVIAACFQAISIYYFVALLKSPRRGSKDLITQPSLFPQPSEAMDNITRVSVLGGPLSVLQVGGY